MLKSLAVCRQKCMNLWGNAPIVKNIKRRTKWLYSNATNAVLPRKADANRKNARHVLKQEPCRNRTRVNPPVAAAPVQEKNNRNATSPCRFCIAGACLFFPGAGVPAPLQNPASGDSQPGRSCRRWCSFLALTCTDLVIQINLTGMSTNKCCYKPFQEAYDAIRMSTVHRETFKKTIHQLTDIAVIESPQ